MSGSESEGLSTSIGNISQKERQMSQLEVKRRQRIYSLPAFFSIWVLNRLHALLPHGRGQTFLTQSTDSNLLISSRFLLPETSRNNVLPSIWISFIPATVTHTTNHLTQYLCIVHFFPPHPQCLGQCPAHKENSTNNYWMKRCEQPVHRQGNDNECYFSLKCLCAYLIEYTDYSKSELWSCHFDFNDAMDFHWIGNNLFNCYNIHEHLHCCP